MTRLAWQTPAARATAGRPRLRLGRIPIDVLTFGDALRHIEALVDAGAGGAVYTPNVDHVVIAESNEMYRRAYDSASLALPDGMPVVWAARLLGYPTCERVAGSDLFLPLMELAARRQWRVYLSGGAPGVAEAAATHLRGRIGVNVVGWNSPAIGADGSEGSTETSSAIGASRADLVIVAYGSPKQELWIHGARGALGASVAVGVGAALDFVTGTQKRAPRWMARHGLEWLHRLFNEPTRLWRRYLLRDPKFFLVFLSTWWSMRVARLTTSPLGPDAPCHDR